MKHLKTVTRMPAQAQDATGVDPEVILQVVLDVLTAILNLILAKQGINE